MKQKVFSLLVALVLLLTFPLTAFAIDGTVTIQAPGILSFGPGSSFTETDLFDSFKNVMPGDTRSQHIVIHNNWVKYDHIRVYLRAAAHDASNSPASGVGAADSNAFLSQLSMTVTRSRDNKEVFRASPEKLDGLQNNVLLATLNRGESTSLDVELAVPIRLGNDYANRVGEVDWIFTIEGHYDSDAPKTGDFWLPWAMGAMLLSGAALILCMRRRTKKQ